MSFALRRIPLACIVATVLILILTYARCIEPNRLVIRRVRVAGRDGARRAPLRIALISDFHYPRYSSYGQVRRAIEASNRFDPHLVFLLGDFFDKHREDPAILPDNVGEVFGGIQSRLGVFGVLGNHDHWFDEAAIRRALQTETNIHLVDNAAIRVELPDDVFIVGVGDLWTGTVDYEQAVENVPADASILLLSHNPDVVEQIRDPRILIQFSGHTHGGQVRLPFIGALRVPSKFGNRYASGLVTRGNHAVYINSGICSMKGIRFLCPPEVTWIEIG